MKSMYTFKIIDFIGQILCLAIPVLLAIFHGETEIVLAAYFSVGGWQLLSFFINWLGMNESLKSGKRKVYNILLIIIMLSLILFAVKVSIAFLLLYVYLFFTPFMALLYFLITIDEMITFSRLVKRDEFVEKR